MAEATSKGAPFVVALTGGIAAGKTAVSDRFARLGVPVIDTDVIARELVEPGRPLLTEIRDAFGPGIIDDKGRLRRSELRQVVFEDPDARRRLEAILHPAILEAATERIADCRAPYCLLVIPLLAETGGHPGADRVLVVEASEESRIRRIAARDGVSRDQARAAIATQASDEERRAIADDLIRNDGAPEELDEQVEALHARYLEMALERSRRTPGPDGSD